MAIVALLTLCWAAAAAHQQPQPRPGAAVALNGNDVVAYHTRLRHLLGDRDSAAHLLIVHGVHDVLGSPQHRRFVNASERLRTTPDLLRNASGHAAGTPWAYEFWFESEANAQAFEKEPTKYIPAFGGHCTHGLASRNDLNAELVVDGRVAFTCVNTTQWSLINGTVYMNSCGMYADFIKDPAADIAAANKLWMKWFDGPSTGSSAVGPINDACFQDGGAWDGPPDWTGNLLPPRCVIN